MDNIRWTVHHRIKEQNRTRKTHKQTNNKHINTKHLTNTPTNKQTNPQRDRQTIFF